MRAQPPAPDPLEAFSGLSLFPRTLGSLPNPPPPSGTDDLQHTHDFLKSMPLQSPNKLLEQAKEIVDNCSELVNLDTTSSVAEVMENPRERRPALGRKRARFSLKPNSSQPTVSLEPSIDIDKLKDPEEFFMAYERAENAKREIQKQTGGVLMDLDQNSQSLAARPRRPGMLRKSVKNKHRYSTAMSPLENLEEENASTLCDSQQEKHDMDVELEEKELAGLATNAENRVNEEHRVNEDNRVDEENRVNELLDQLLTSDFDGDETVSLLQEHLQIKPIDMEKICLPDLQGIRRIDLKASRKSLAKPRNSSTDIPENSVHYVASPTPPKGPLASISLLKKRMLLSDLPSDPFSTDDIDHSLARDASPVKNINKQSDLVDTEREVRLSPNDNRRTQKQDESSAHPLASPTPPRNPFASMSLQKKQLLQSDPPSAPFSVDNIDRSPGRNASPTESINKQYSQGGAENRLNMSHLLKSPMLEANQTEIANAGSELDGRDFAGLFDKFVNDNARRFDSGIDMVSSGSQADLERSRLNRPETDADSHSINPNECDGRVEDILVVPGVSAQTQLNEEAPTVNDPHTTQRESDESNPAMDVDHTVDESLRTAEGGQELREEQTKKGKAKPRPRNERKRKAVNRRQSLAGSGTTVDTEGRRRSTRIRSRPLEFWKGERFIYGRIHSSLATVIGIKYESPGKGDGTLKVKSFVSDEYKDLVEQAGMY